ncbi:MAG: MFS transporter [Desulfococcaceae bacterium]|jgi:MFS family permease|nr:MFS transporter [Desulfococcaceae bacterium]
MARAITGDESETGISPCAAEKKLRHRPDFQKTPLFTKEFILLLHSGLLLTTGFGTFYLFPLYILNLGGSKSDIGILMAAMSLSAVLVRPWISELVDRIGRKGSMAMGTFLLVSVSIAHIFFKDTIDNLFPVLLLLRILFGTGTALSIIASFTLVTDLAAGPRLNEGLGIFGIMPMLGIAAGPVIGERIIHYWGFDGMFLTGAFFFSVSFLFMIPLKDRFRPPAVRERGGFMKALRIPAVWRMSLICLCFGTAFAAHGGFAAPFAKSLHLPVSVYFGAYSAAAVLSRLFGSRLAERFGEMRIIPAALIIAGIGFLSFLYTDSIPDMIFTGFVAGLGHGLLFPSLIALTIRPVAAIDRGKVTGILTGGFDSGMFIGSFILGHIGEYFGFPMIFTAAAAALFTGLLIFLKIKHSIPPAE